jgi:hypothetical protein
MGRYTGSRRGVGRKRTRIRGSAGCRGARHRCAGGSNRTAIDRRRQDQFGRYRLDANLDGIGVDDDDTWPRVAIGLRVTEEQEREGLDISLHGEKVE